MKLRKRTKDTTPVNQSGMEENEEDVDDPEVDSDSDPEWGDSEGDRGEQLFSSAKKRKSFVPIPLQMQSEANKVKPTWSKIVKSPKDPSGSTPLQIKSESNKKPTWSKVVRAPKNTLTSASATTSCSDKDKKSITSLYRDKTFENSEVLKEVAGESGDEEIDREDMYTELELMKELGIRLTHCTVPSQALNRNSNVENLTHSKTPGDINLLAKPSTSTAPVKYNVIEQTMVLKDGKGGTTNCPFRVIKMDTPVNVITPSKSSTVSVSTSFYNGEFLKDISKKDNRNCIWQVDGMNLLQKFVPVKDEKTGKTLYKSSFTYDGLNALNTSRFKRISATIVSKVKNETFVQVNEELNLLDTNVEVKKEPECDNEALISQCLDSSFLRTVYNDHDEYFVDKIKVIDDVLEAKKFSLMSLPTFPNNDRILYAIHTYPVIEEKQLPAIKMENFNCVVCVEQTMREIPVYSNVCLELTGDPYERNTLLQVKLLVDIDDDLKVLRVCTSCSTILKLYSKMCHTKYLIYKQCDKSVQKILENQQSKGEPLEASEVIISLLNNEPWCETKLLQLIRDWITIDDLRKEAV
ncbi:hypothetical protein M8J76_011515 [Diaphorina citri]|nr:hypothetical protein M8J76_011515 [Diaphorina citri]